MSKKEPKDPVKWNGFTYMEVKDYYLGAEVRVHPFLPYNLDKIVVEGYVIELGNIITKTVLQDNGENISPHATKVILPKKKGITRRVEIEFSTPVQPYKY